MWKFGSKSFSKSCARAAQPATSIAASSSSSASSFCVDSSSPPEAPAPPPPAFSSSSSSSALIFSALGLQPGGSKPASAASSVRASRHAWSAGTNVSNSSPVAGSRPFVGSSTRPYDAASRFAVAITNAATSGSESAKLSGVGKRFGGTQNGLPSRVTWSRGNWWMRSRILWSKRRTQSSVASRTHAAKPPARAAAAARAPAMSPSPSSPRSSLIALSTSLASMQKASASPRTRATCAAGSARYSSSAPSGVTKRSSNAPRAHSMQCTIVDGKLRSVHMGIASPAGGSGSPSS